MEEIIRYTRHLVTGVGGEMSQMHRTKLIWKCKGNVSDMQDIILELWEISLGDGDLYSIILDCSHVDSGKMVMLCVMC